MPELRNGCRIFRNCKIAGVYTKLNTEKIAYKEILIEIKSEEDGKVPVYEYIHMSSKYGLYKELVDMKEGRRDRVYGTYGMGNIDIVSSKLIGNYSIEWSPMDGVYDIFDFDRKDFEENFISALAPECVKDPENL